MGGLSQVVGGTAQLLDLPRQIGAQQRNITETYRSAALEDLNAVDSVGQGQSAAARLRAKGGDALNRQRVAYAVSGVDAQTGTPLTTASGTAMYAELDAQQALNNAYRQAFGHEQAARGFRMQADNALSNLNSDITGAMVGGLSSIIGGAVSTGLSAGFGGAGGAPAPGVGTWLGSFAGRGGS